MSLAQVMRQRSENSPLVGSDNCWLNRGPCWFVAVWVMEAAARGCAEAGGDVIGVLPGMSAMTANPYVTLPIVTNMGHARNVIIAHTAEALIAIEGEYGTLSEMAIGLKLGKTVVQLGSWSDLPDTFTAETPEQAVAVVMAAVKETETVSKEEK